MWWTTPRKRNFWSKTILNKSYGRFEIFVFLVISKIYFIKLKVNDNFGQRKLYFYLEKTEYRLLKKMEILF